MATGAQEHIDATTADVFIPEIWSKEAIVAREQELLFAELVNRVYEKELSVGDVVHVPSVGNLAVQTKSRTANAATIYETVTEANKDVTVSTWQYSAIAIETATKEQVNRDMLAMYAPKQGYALAQAIDDVLAGLVDDFSQTVGTLATEVTYEDLLRARQYLDDADAPADDRVLVVSPAQEAGFLKLDHFVHRDYEVLHGDVSKKAMNRGYIGTFLGMPVYKSTNVEGTNAAGHDNGLFQKEALALIVQMKATTHKMFDIDYLAHKVVVEHLHGSAEMRDDHGVFLCGA